MIQRVHITIGDFLRKMKLKRKYNNVSAHGDIQIIAWRIRAFYCISCRASPDQLAFGRDMVIPTTYLANWRHIHSHRKCSVLYANTRKNFTRIPYYYNDGNYVYILSKGIVRKLAPFKQGPFLITRAHSDATVTI